MEFPNEFAILRNRNSCFLSPGFQVFTSFELPSGRFSCHMLTDDNYLKTFAFEHCSIPSNNRYFVIISNIALNSKTFWFMPFWFRSGEKIIPILEFYDYSDFPKSSNCLIYDGFQTSLILDIYKDVNEQHVVLNNTGTPLRLIGRGRSPPRPTGHYVRSLPSRGRSPPGLPSTPQRSQRSQQSQLTIATRGREVYMPHEAGLVLIKNARNENSNCPITMELYRNIKYLCITSCFHIFDKEAFKTWYGNSNECPVCRTQFTNVIMEEETPTAEV